MDGLEVQVEGEGAASAPPASHKVSVIDDKTATIVDSAGRTIKVRRISALQRMRLFRLVGAADSTNMQVVAYAVLAASVVELDGVPNAFPTSGLAIEAMVDRLDDHGLDAVAGALKAITPDDKEVAAAAQNL